MNANKQDAGGLPNELGFEQWYVTNTFDYPSNPLGSRDCSIARKAWHAALEAVRNGEQCRAASVSWAGYEAFEQFLAAEIDSAPEALRRLGDWLCNVLDEDHFATANRMVIGAMMETSAAIRALSRGVPEGCDSSAGAPCGGFRTKHGEHFDILYQAFTYASAADAKRLDWLAHHGASLRNDCQAEGGGWFVIAPYHTGISSVDGRARFATARAAIDAAMEGDE